MLCEGPGKGDRTAVIVETCDKFDLARYFMRKRGKGERSVYFMRKNYDDYFEVHHRKRS